MREDWCCQNTVVSNIKNSTIYPKCNTYCRTNGSLSYWHLYESRGETALVEISVTISSYFNQDLRNYFLLRLEDGVTSRTVKGYLHEFELSFLQNHLALIPSKQRGSTCYFSHTALDKSAGTSRQFFAQTRIRC